MLRTRTYERIVELVESRARPEVVFGSERSSIQDLPVELVVAILVQLSVRDIVRWRLVSKHFRVVIESSVTLQYIITCNRCDIIVEPPNTLRNRQDQLDSMRAWTEAWKTVTWKLEFANTTAPAEDVSLSQAPSITRCVKVNPVNHSDLHFPSGYTYDAENDVLIASELNITHGTIRLHALALPDQQPHPLRSPVADDMVCRIKVDMAHSEAHHLNIGVSGSLVLSYGLYSQYPVGDGFITEVWVHDWKTGELLMNFWSGQFGNLQFNDWAFLDDQYILITVQGATPFLIAVFDCYDIGPHSCSLKDMLEDAMLILELPELSDDTECVFLGVQCQQRRKALPYRYTDAKFTPANSSPVIHVDFPVEHGGQNCRYEILIPNETIFSRISQSEPPRRIPWEEWSQETRFFEGIDRLSQPAVSGSRYAARELDLTSGQYYLAIYNFCPLPTMLRELVNDRHADAVIKPTIVVNEDAFIDVAITKVPYLRVKTDVVLAEDELPSLTEDHITIWKVVPVQGQISPRLSLSRVFCF